MALCNIDVAVPNQSINQSISYKVIMYFVFFKFLVKYMYLYFNSGLSALSVHVPSWGYWFFILSILFPSFVRVLESLSWYSLVVCFLFWLTFNIHGCYHLDCTKIMQLSGRYTLPNPLVDSFSHYSKFPIWLLISFFESYLTEFFIFLYIYFS